MNPNEIESEHSHLTVVGEPENANLLFDSVSRDCLRINGWVTNNDSYQVAVQTWNAIETVTVPQYIQSSNQYYFVQSESLFENR